MATCGRCEDGFVFKWEGNPEKKEAHEVVYLCTCRMGVYRAERYTNFRTIDGKAARAIIPSPRTTPIQLKPITPPERSDYDDE